MKRKQLLKPLCTASKSSCFKFFIRALQPAVLLLLICLGSTYTAFAQGPRISVSFTNVPLKQAISELEAKSGYYFLYNNKFVDATKKVSATMQNSTLADVLSEVLKGSGIEYKIVDQQVLLSVPSTTGAQPEVIPVAEAPGSVAETSGNASQGLQSKSPTAAPQQVKSGLKKVTGVVKDAAGELLPFAAVVLKGTKISTNTSLEGFYSINVPQESSVLVFTSMGYVAQEVPIGAGSVVNVTMSPDAVMLEGAYVTSYGARKVSTNSGAVSILKTDKLQQPVANVTQMLQGQSAGVYSAATSGKPGAAAETWIRGVGSINSSSSPLYVVDGIIVSANQFSSINSSDIESITVLKDAASTALYGSRAANGVILVTTKAGRTGDARVTLTMEGGYSRHMKENYGMMNTEQKLALEVDAGYVDYGSKDYMERMQHSSDQFDEYFRDAWMQRYNVEIQGGNDRTTYYISGGYMNQDGIVERTGFERYTIRTNIASTVKRWLKAGSNFSAGYTINQDSPNEGAGASTANLVFAALVTNPYERLRDDNGNYTESLVSYPQNANPLYQATLSEKSSSSFSARNNTFLEFKLNEDLKLKSSVGIELVYALGKSWYSPESLIAANDNGISDRTSGHSMFFSQTNTLSYTKQFEEKHNLSLGLVEEVFTDNSSLFSVSVKDVSHPELKELGQYLEIYPGNWGSSSSATRTLSGLFFGNYDYDGKYFAEGSVRADGDSRFGPGNKWGIFWSLGAGWNMHKEKFMSDLKWISKLKLRASAGSVGNSGIGNYASWGMYSLSYRYNDKPGGAQGSIGNEKLTWETTHSYNLGLDAGLFENRLRLTAEVYRKNTSDMLMNVPLSSTTGSVGSMWQNVGGMFNQGLEVTVGADIINTRKFRLGINANIGLNHNEITDLYHGATEIYSEGTGTVQKIGSPVGLFKQVRWAGVNPVNGSPLWYNVNGDVVSKYSSSDAVVLDGKSHFPNKSAGFTLSTSYKGLSLEAMFLGMWDIYAVNNNLLFVEFSGGSYASQFNQTARSGDYWKNPGDNKQYPALGSESPVDSRSVENHSFFRLKNLMLAYNFGEKSLKKMKAFQGLKLYASAQNLFTITKYRGFDPEFVVNMEMSRYPASITYTLGAQLTF